MTATSTRPGEVIVRRAGEHAVVLDVDPGSVPGLTGWLGRTWGTVVQDIVPGRASVLVRSRDRLTEIVASATAGTWSREQEPVTGRLLRIPVRYDGPDLAEVARRLGLSTRDVARLHSGVEHVVQHFGFSPGFPYLTGSPAELDLPRRDDPRASIPAGSLAIAGCSTVIYPGGTPGGWNIIGHAEAPVFWDLDRDPPNAFEVGDRIVFEPAS